MDKKFAYQRLSTSPLFSAIETFIAQSVMLNGLMAPLLSLYNSAVTKRLTFGEAMLAHFKSPISWGISGALATAAAIKTYNDIKEDHALYDRSVQVGQVQHIALARQGARVVGGEHAEIGVVTEGRSYVEKLEKQASQEIAQGR